MKAIVLGAGKGKRLLSEKHDKPKVMRMAGDRPLLIYVLDSLDFCEEIIVVVGYKKEKVIEAAGPSYTYVDQKEIKGTGHAASVTKDVMGNYNGPVLIAFGDMPLFRISTYKKMFEIHKETGADCTNLTCTYPKDEYLPHYGRIIRDNSGEFVAVREHRDCTETEKLIRETNVGVMVCNVPDMYKYLEMLDCNNSQGEYYLTELPALMKKNGKKVIIHSITDTDEALGANTPEDLDNIIKVLEKRRAEIND